MRSRSRGWQRPREDRSWSWGHVTLSPLCFYTALFH
jgi:hypothetical protein